MKLNLFTKKTKWIVSIGATLAMFASIGVWLGNKDYQLSGKEPSPVVTPSIQEPRESIVGSEKIVPQPLLVHFNMPAAAINVDYARLDKETIIQPAIRGQWRWQSNYVLAFTPETNWVPNTRYKVDLPAYIFNPQVKIKKHRFDFEAPRFSGQVQESAFYEDPRNLQQKFATASFRFSYPLDKQQLKEHISVKTVSGEEYDFTYKLSDLDTVLHVISAPLKIQKDENFVKITVAKVPNAYNKKPLSDSLTATVKVPSSSTFFKVNSIRSDIVRNEQDNDNPEQILFMNFSTAVKADELAQKLHLYYVPESCDTLVEQQSRNGIIRECRTGVCDTPETNQLSQLPTNKQTVPFKEVSTNADSLKQHLLKYDITQRNGCLIVDLPKDLTSVEGFVLGKNIIQHTELAPYPLEAKVAFEGAVLPRNGNKEAVFVSRGVSELQITAARIPAEDLNHLVTQTGGDFAHPYFRSYNFSENNIAEVFSKTLQINAGEHPSQANYSSLNFGEYLQNGKGVFLVKVRGCREENVCRYSFTSNAEKCEKEKVCGKEDRRLIVVTDLGIVVKDNLDNTHNIFVANVSDGKPVAGASVDVLGLNGLTIMQAKTNNDGYAPISDFSDFKKDKEAVVYRVSKGDDVSFLPIMRNRDRVLNMSRFDVGGKYHSEKKDTLQGYIFTDRGIYRPGETGHLGIIVRQNDLNVPQKLPLVLEIENSQGNVIATQNLWTDAAGFIDYEFKLPPEAKTGNYGAYIYRKDTKNSYRSYVARESFNVSEFLPDTLRMEAKWQDETSKGWTTTEALTAKVALSNLYGNPAAEHEIKASYQLIPADFSFEAFKGYVFRDPLRDADTKLRSFDEDLPKTKTDTAGNANLNIDLAKFERGTYRLKLHIDGFELGSGRGVSTGLSTLVSPNKYLVGWKADGDLDYIHKNTSRQVQFIAINNQLESVAQEDLLLRLNRRQYISSLVEAKNGTYQYQMVPKEQLIFANSRRIDVNGLTEKLKTDEPGEYILTLENKNGDSLARLEYTVAGAANLTHAIDKDASLGLKLNRTEYQPGDDIEMQITAPYTGYGLITIEREKVYAYQWFTAETNSVMQKIKLPKEIEGNAYVNVAFFRDINSKEIYMPSLSYAIAPFNINKSTREVKIELEVPHTVRPGEELTIGYKTSVPSKIVIYGVNQGILQVVDYQLPDPLKVFMHKKALQVITSQIMDLIMPDIRIVRMLTSSGGGMSYDADGNIIGALDRNLNPFARKADKPVAFWSGVIEADEQGGTYRYKVPETFNGELKVMAVAASDERFGNASATVLSRGDFALIPSGPLNVSPGDEFVIGVNVGNLIDNAGDNYGVRVRLEPGYGFEVIDTNEQTIQITEGGEAMVRFKLRALSDIGPKEIWFTAESLNDKTKKARMPYPISLRPASPYTGKFTLGMAESSYTLENPENLYPAFRVQQVSASSSPLVLATGMLKYLDKFPHPCTEQSVSKIFAALDVFFKYPELVEGTDVYALFDDVIAKLHARQAINGGFKIWGGSWEDPDPYVSVYTTHFLLKAKEHNFNVPENMLNRALDYCAEQAARAPKTVDDFVPAYAIYVLTLSGKVTTNYLLNLEEFYQKQYAKTWQQHLGTSFMAASYKLLQDQKQAKRLFGKYQDRGHETETAMNMYLNALHFSDNTKTLEKASLQKLLNRLSSGNFTTSSAAWSVLALNAIGNDTDKKDIKFSSLEPTYTPFPTVSFEPQTKDLTVRSDKPFYYVVAQQGFPVEKETQALAEGLEVSKVYYDHTGKEVHEAKIGDVLTVKVSYRSLDKPIDNVAIVDLLPGCVEITKDYSDNYPVAFHEIREDRFIAHVWVTSETRNFTYKVRVVAEGGFVVPAVHGSALYQPLIRAHSVSGWMNVTK